MTGNDMSIIYSGTVMLTSILDAGTEMAIEYIGKGTILKSTNFLAQRGHVLTAKCLTSVTFYYLEFDKISEIAHIYPPLAAALNSAQTAARYDKMLELNPIDYIETQFEFEDKYEPEICAKLTESERKRVPKLRLAMKNAVFHYLTMKKKLQKMNSLTSILEKAALNMMRKKVENEA